MIDKILHEFRAKYKINEKYGKLKILKYLGDRKYLCKCDCGNETICRSAYFTNGNKKSCGCLRTINRENYLDEVKEILLNSIIISESNCWDWKKSKNKSGYGQIMFKRKSCLAHRISWIIFKDEIIDKSNVLHKCDNPSCINPDHLFLGTQQDNIKDMFNKKRSKWQKLSKEDVVNIRLMFSKNVDRLEIVKKYKISLSNLCQILKNQIWKE